MPADITRRQILRSAMWTAPVIAVAVAVPQAAASVEPPEPTGLFIAGYLWDPNTRAGYVLFRFEGIRGPENITAANIEVSDPRVTVANVVLGGGEWYATLVATEVIQTFSVTIRVDGFAPAVIADISN